MKGPRIGQGKCSKNVMEDRLDQEVLAVGGGIGNWVCVMWLATNQLRFIRLCRLGGTHVLGIGGIKFNQYNS